MAERARSNSQVGEDIESEIDGLRSRIGELEASVSECRDTERMLRESEQKFRDLAEFSPNMIFINRNGRVTYANRICEEVMGYRREEFYASDFDFRYIIAPESRERIAENFRRHSAGEDVPPYEYTLLTKEGKRLHALISSKLIRINGERAILGIVTDITYLKNTEHSLRESYETILTVLESIDADVYVADMESHEILYANSQVQKSFGDDPTGKTCYKVFRQERPPADIAPMTPSSIKKASRPVYTSGSVSIRS
jgi:two-component system cell cycle sensor histidine kinase/response regulator CckA